MIKLQKPQFSSKDFSRFFSLYSSKRSVRIVSLFLTVFLTLSSNINAQNSPELKKNTVYAEAFGSSGFLYQVAYDRILFSGELAKLSVAAGFQYMPGTNFIGPSFDLYSISPQINLLYGNKNHLEVGLAFPVDISNVLFHFEFKKPLRAAIIHFGYRYQPNEGGLFIRANINPALRNDFISDDMGAGDMFLMPGFSLGYSF